MVSGALLAPAGRSARRKLRLLPPIRGSLCRAGQRRSPTHLGRDRPSQPQREHRADERQGAPDPREGTGSLGPERATEEDLKAACGRPRTYRGPDNRFQVQHSIHRCADGLGPLAQATEKPGCTTSFLPTALATLVLRTARQNTLLCA